MNIILQYLVTLILKIKKYFEDWIETKFEVDNLIIYKRKTYKITKIYQFNGIRKNTFTRFKVVDINNPNLVIELNETEINNSTLTKEYFFH